MNATHISFLTERLLTSSVFRIQEASYGYHSLTDYDMTMELAWMSDRPEEIVYALAIEDEDGRREMLVEPPAQAGPIDIVASVAALNPTLIELSSRRP